MEFLKKSKITECEINGERVKLKGMPLGVIFKIRNLAEGNKAIAKLLATLFVDKSKDSGIQSETILADADKELYDTKQTIAPIDPNIAAMRMRDLELGIEGLTSLVTSKETEELIAEIIYHCAFELYKGRGIKIDECKAELMELGLDITLELLMGSFKASSGVLNVLGKLFPQTSKSMAEKVSEMKGSLGI
jgi:hypothetical protein